MRAAGWSPGRRIDTAAWRVSFAGTGLSMHEAAAEFLGQFGGLLFHLDLRTSSGPIGGWAGNEQDNFINGDDILR
jgi:hypothetical protein